MNELATKANTVALLMAGRILISDPEAWCTGALAKLRGGHSTSPTSPLAERWCMFGSLRAFAGWESPLYCRGRQAIVKQLPKSYLVFPGLYNDEKGHRAVIAAMDRAIDAVWIGA
jgi:hypothetical protein